MSELLYSRMLKTFTDAVGERGRRQEVEQRGEEWQMGWVFYERDQMLAAVNAERARRGLEPIDEVVMARVENGAAGHSDYAHKIALRCSFLAEGRDE